MVRIAWRDLAELAGLEETLGDLTDLAEALVGAALERLHSWQARRFGEPRDEPSKKTLHLVRRTTAALHCLHRLRDSDRHRVVFSRTMV